MISYLFVLIQVILLIFTCADKTAAGTRIGMMIEKENTATYIETLEGFRKELAKSGKDYTFIEKNAKQNIKTMEAIAKAFSSDPKIRWVVVLGSLATTIANQHIKNKPVIVGGINHPGGLKITAKNITGTTYYINPSTVVNLITRLSPDVQRVGILYEAFEQNAASRVEVPETEKALQNASIDFVKERVKAENEIINKTKRIIESDVEYLIIPTNRLLYSNVNLIRKASDTAGVPIVSFSRKGVLDGALIAITSNNHAQGVKMAQMLIDVVEQVRSTREIPWYFPNKFSILVNEMTRLQLGIQIPKRIYSIATILNPKSAKSSQN